MNYKLGDAVRILKNTYTDENMVVDNIHVYIPNTIGFVTDVNNYGCQVSLVPYSDPDEHSERSLFFLYEEFERA